MSTLQNEADRAERQARIQEDIRRLFARYRRTSQTPTRFTQSGQRSPESRFRREPPRSSPGRG